MAGQVQVDTADVLWDGFIAGALGSVVVALWFLVLDMIQGHPLHTPTLLGTIIFAGPQAAVGVSHADPGTVALYSGVHMGLFSLFGIGVSWLIAQFRRRPILGYLMLFIFVLFEFFFYVFILAVAQPVVAELPAWEILVGNLLAAAVMGAYFVVRYPEMLRPKETDGTEEYRPDPANAESTRT